jgi:hypothetical protein
LPIRNKNRINSASLLEGQIHHPTLRRQQESSEHLPALKADVEYEISRRLYSNPQFLGFVKQVMGARGGFVSPLVQHFTAFYLRCLKEKVHEWEKEEGVNTHFWQERLASIIGQAEAQATEPCLSTNW